MTHTSKPDQWTLPRWRDRARRERGARISLRYASRIHRKDDKRLRYSRGRDCCAGCAWKRALDLIDERVGRKGWAYERATSGAVCAFARYIAAHEQPPVDPAIAAALELSSAYYSGDKYRGEVIPTAKVLAELALRRGMELAQLGVTVEPK